MSHFINKSDTHAKARRRRLGASLAFVGVVGPMALLLAAPAAFADTVSCTATSGYWRWGGSDTGSGARLNLGGTPKDSTSGNTYLDAFRRTEASGSMAVDWSSRAGLDESMDERFTIGPPPWLNNYSDKRLIGLANFKATTGNLGGFSIGAYCVPNDATITGVWVRTTHAVRDAGTMARIRVNDGTSSTFAPFAIPEPDATGIGDEKTTDTDVLSVLNSAAKVNGALVQFQAMRAGGANHTIHNEISLIVEYTGGTPPPPPQNDLVKLVTGGGYVTSGTYSNNRGNFGFNARSFVEGGNATASGNFEYNDGRLQVKGRVDTITLCSNSAQTFNVTGDYVGRVGNSKDQYSGRFTVIVDDNGEPGRNDTISLDLTPPIGSFGGFTTTTLTGGNIQHHFCDLP